MLDWDQEISGLNNLIVSGEIQSCRARLDEFTPKSVPRKHAATLAQLANRVEDPLFALKILHPLIYPENNFEAAAESKEKLVYCHALLILGAHAEAHEILDTIDPKKNAEVLFHKAMAFVSEWNYKKSIPLLTKYLESSKLDPYRKVIAEVNLAAGFIAVNSWKKATKLLTSIQAECKAANYQLLLGNSYELLAQAHFFQRDYESALHALQAGQEILAGQPGVYGFYIQKWIGFCKAFQTGNTENFATLRKHGKENNYFETVRESDLFEAILRKDEALIRKVVVGTPSPQYRERARALFRKTLRPQGTYLLQLGPDAVTAGAGNTSVFDPQEKMGPEQGRLSETPLLFSLYEALTEDFYKPSYLGALFKSVYPDEKFNPASSPARVLSLLRRLDEWFKAAGISLEVVFKKSEFSLRSKTPLQIVVRRGQKKTLQDSTWSVVRAEYGHRSFTTGEVGELLKVSKASALRMVQAALKERRIETSGQGNQTAYHFTKKA